MRWSDVNDPSSIGQPTTDYPIVVYRDGLKHCAIGLEATKRSGISGIFHGHLVAALEQ